jgi:hypothetical protein
MYKRVLGNQTDVSKKRTEGNSGLGRDILRKTGENCVTVS